MMNETNVIPSNIMLKSSYGSFLTSTPKWKIETINELYNYIYTRTDPTDHKFLELEVKLGTYRFEGAYRSLVIVEDIFKIPRNEGPNISFFESKVGENDFFSIKFFIEKEMERRNSGIFPLDPELYNEMMYTSGKRKSEITNYRTRQKKTVVIKKEDKHHIQLRNCGSDLRITICKEYPKEMEDNDVVESYRDKFRMSYKFRFFRLDLTITQGGRTVMEKNSSPKSFEVEFEFDEINIRTMEFGEYDSFFKIIERFLENSFALYHTISKDYFVKFYSASNNSQSLFGDYIQNVCEAQGSNGSSN
jgi:hypothetical protein